MADDQKLPRRALDGARRLNRNPRLIELARGKRPDHGHRQGFMGELGTAALDVWQRVAESQARGRGDADVAILFTDLVGFSSWALEAGDAATIQLLDEVGEAIEPPILERRGEVVKRLGDGLMAAFGSGSAALDAALAGGERVAAIEVGGYRPRLRTGIHLGRPRKLRGDYFGVDVNIAARLADAAKPGEILASSQLLALIGADRVEKKRRRFSAKGAPKGLEVYAVRRPDPPHRVVP